MTTLTPNFFQKGIVEFNGDTTTPNTITVNESKIQVKTPTNTFTLNDAGYTINALTSTWTDTHQTVVNTKALRTPPLSNPQILAVQKAVLVVNDNTTPTASIGIEADNSGGSGTYFGMNLYNDNDQDFTITSTMPYQGSVVFNQEGVGASVSTTAIKQGTITLNDSIKTLTLDADGLSSTGNLSLGTATVNLTTSSTAITQTYPSNTTALATTQYVSTAISNIPAPPASNLSSVLIAGNTASGTSASISLTNLPKQTIISPTSVFLNDTTIVQQATLNTEKLRLLTSGLTNDITSDKMLITKPATGSLSEYSTDGVSLTGLFGAESRSGGFNLTSGATINNNTTKLSGTLNEAFVSLDGNTTSSALGNKSTLNASGLTCVNKVTPSTTSSLTPTALNLGITGTTLTVSPTGLSSTNILNLNSTSQIDTNCSIRVLATPPSSAGRAILSNGQLSMQNVAPALQNTISSTSSAITNGTKTITMTVDGLSSNGAMSLGTATVNLTSGSSGITQTYPSNTTALATTQYVTTAISNIPASAIPTLQSVTNQGNTITNGTKTLTLSVNGLDSTGEIAINNNTGTTRIRGTSTIDNINSTNYDTIGTDLTTKLLNSLTTGNLEIGNNMTTGSINFGSKMTSGNLFIMNDALATGDITMFNNSSSATGKLKVRGGGIQTKEIEASSGIKSLTYNGLSALNDLDIGDNIVNKTISIGRLMTTGGIVNIGAGLSDINLLAINSTAITQTTGNNSNRIATTAFVNSSIAVIPAPSLQQVLNAGNTANETIILSKLGITNDIRPNKIIIRDDAGTEEINLSNQSLSYITPTNELTLSSVGIVNKNSDNTINSSLTKNSLTLTENTGTTTRTITLSNPTIGDPTILLNSVNETNEMNNKQINIYNLSTDTQSYLTRTQLQLTSTTTDATMTKDDLILTEAVVLPAVPAINTINRTGMTLSNSIAKAVYDTSGLVISNLANTVSNTISKFGSSLIDTGKSTFYNLDGLNIQKIVGPITSIFGAQPDVINISSTDSSLSTSNNIQIASDYIYLTDETTFSNSITSDDIQISNGTLKTIYNSNSITSTDNLTINSAATKLLKIGSGSATENVEIATQAARSVVLHLGDGINNIVGSGVHINNGVGSVGNTQINNGSGQTGQINIGNATSGTTTTNLRGNTNIEGVVNINGVGSTNTGLITIGNTSVGAITNVVGTQVNLTNPRINQPISILYTSILPALGTAGLNQIGGRAVYYNNGGSASTGTGFFTTTGTTKQVYGFFNAVPTGRYLVSALLQMNNSLASMQVDMRTVYNTNTSPSFPQPLTLNQTTNLGDSSAGTNTFSSNIIDFSDVKPSGARYNPFQSAIVDITPTIGNQLGLAITFGTANVGTSGAFSLFLNFSLLRIS